MLYGEAWWWRLYAALPHTIRTGETASTLFLELVVAVCYPRVRMAQGGFYPPPERTAVETLWLSARSPE